MVHEVVSRHRHQKRPRSHLPLVLGPLGAGRRTCCPREERRYCPQGEQRHCPQGEHRSLCTRPCHYRRHRHILHTLVGVDGETYGRLRVVLCVWWCCGGVVVGRGVLRFKKGVCSKRVSGSVVLEASSSRARFICTTVVQIGVATKIADMSCFMSRSVIFQIQKNHILLLHRFLRVGPTLGGGVEPGRADGAWPSPRPAKRVIILKSRAQARPRL